MSETLAKSCVCCSCDEEHWEKMHLRSACEAKIHNLEEELYEALAKVTKKFT